MKRSVRPEERGGNNFAATLRGADQKLYRDTNCYTRTGAALGALLRRVVGCGTVKPPDWCRTVNRLLRARVPRPVPWALAGLLIASGIGSCEVVTRPHNGLRADSLQFKARVALPAGSSREQVEAWLNANELAYKPVFDKGGTQFLWYLVQMENGSWLHPRASFWMRISFDTERLSEIHAGQDQW